MNKFLIALGLTLGLTSSAAAGSIHDFDPSRVAAAPSSLDGQCYSTNGDSRVCFFRITDEIFAVSVNDANSTSEFAQVFTVNCDNGRWRGFGPMEQENNARFATAFCRSGRY